MPQPAKIGTPYQVTRQKKIPPLAEPLRGPERRVITQSKLNSGYSSTIALTNVMQSLSPDRAFASLAASSAGALTG